VYTPHPNGVGVAAAAGVGATIDRINGADAAAAPTLAERTAISRRVTTLPLPFLESRLMT
jgi:hypothetical protein